MLGKFNINNFSSHKKPFLPKYLMDRVKEKLEFAKGRIAMLEAYSDAIAIFIKSKNLEVKDRYSNIELLENLGMINKEETKL